MSHKAFEWIRCPFCSGRFDPAEISEDFDIWTCGCGRYPVVSSIPVLKRGAVGVRGETIEEVTRLIEAGKFREALLSLTMPPPPDSPDLAPAWMQALPSIKGIRRLRHLSHQRGVDRWREEAAALLTRAGNDATACELLDLYYHRSGLAWNDAYDYFALRFGQPRHLVALSFTTLIDASDAPILDLACGCGHVTRSLAARGRQVIGVDQTFISLYIAKSIIAPGATYVCCLADGPLPFPDHFFSAVFCSDAFHYFSSKASSVLELKRITQEDGTIVLAWMHNKLWRRPYDGEPLNPEGYCALMAETPHRMVADSDVLVRYLQKKGPPLAGPSDVRRLCEAPLLSLVASRRQDIFQDYGSFKEWPHAQGPLGLNPLYRIEERPGAGEDVALRRIFPSDFYIEEHSESREYLPEIVSTRFQTLIDVKNGKRTSEIESLVEQFVVLGMPERYV